MNILRFASLRLAPFFLFFLIAETAARIALALYNPTDLAGGEGDIAVAFLRGFVFDLAVFCFLAIPVFVLPVFLPRHLHGGTADRTATGVVFFLFSFIMTFSAVGEWFFWDEFQTRYNFIAVDYLVYTHEVIGNIRESYPVGPIVGGIALLCAALAFGVAKLPDRFYTRFAYFRTRFCALLLILGLAAFSFMAADKEQARISENRYVSELARNGIFELFSAFRHNELDYANFYITKPENDIRRFVAEKTDGDANAPSPLLHAVANKKTAKPYNLVLITVESLSADYLKHFGGTFGVTPKLDALIPQSLFFNNLYATGTRTVYGLSALTLGMPPIPGNSIVRRPDNGNMFSIGHVLREKGYATKFIYGGFGYFDNMNAFFSANGYEIVDRANLAKNEITFANIWGVADGDLYDRVLKENDKAHAQGKPFFDMVMTTSNHRPYTFPDGKIDLKSGSGRRGGVKYTDFAIDEFLQKAKAKPWFKDTIFVIVADHTAGSSGKSDIDPKKYHIPMWVYAPGIVKPGFVDTMASQIDVAPTLLGLMGVSYGSKFYGRDVLKEKPGRVFISNYQQLGYMTDRGLVVLKPPGKADFFTKGSAEDFVRQEDLPTELLDEAVGYYQGASYWKEWSRKE